MKESDDQSFPRKEMESTVLAVNKYLTDAVKKMIISDLLANMHPFDREYYIRKRFDV